jgi:DNA-binding SARP family transcriptional activator
MAPINGWGRRQGVPLQPRIVLIDGFELWWGQRQVPVPRAAQRVAAFLALHDRTLPRLFVGASLWPEATEQHAAGCLRSALWRLRQSSDKLVEVTNSHVGLSKAVQVDVRDLVGVAQRLVDHAISPSRADLNSLGSWGELLPGWYDDWVTLEREVIRQLRLHALELLCERFTAVGRYSCAIEAGLSAVAADPLRESAHRLLIKAYLAEGNRHDAIRQFQLYRRLLYDELGLEPSSHFQELLRASLAS